MDNVDLQNNYTPLNLLSGSFLKPFEKLAARVLSNLKHWLSLRVLAQNDLTICFLIPKTSLIQVNCLFKNLVNRACFINHSINRLPSARLYIQQ